MRASEKAPHIVIVIEDGEVALVTSDMQGVRFSVLNCDYAHYGYEDVQLFEVTDPRYAGEFYTASIEEGIVEYSPLFSDAVLHHAVAVETPDDDDDDLLDEFDDEEEGKLFDPVQGAFLRERDEDRAQEGI